MPGGIAGVVQREPLDGLLGDDESGDPWPEKTEAAMVSAEMEASQKCLDETPEDPAECEPNRPLTWDDFQAKPIRQLDGARSALNYRTAVGCRNQRLQVRVLTVFLPAQSSVTYRIISSGLASRVGLAHEQLHFDLSEVFARRIRRMYAELQDPCPRPDQALDALADPLFREAAETQNRYDDYTRFGESEARQLEWAKRIAADLAELEPWAHHESVF
jgi:hypothetical protein